MTQGIFEHSWVRDVLAFWFKELHPTDWFAGNDATDEKIRARFLGLHERIASSEGSGMTAPESVLAGVIVLDQFSRNLFRGQASAFAADPLARRLARDAIAQGFDEAMTAEQRFFLYLPFEHSEDRADQVLAVELIGRLGREDWTRYAEAHKSVIDRFGRYPHRNAALGRPSTPEEIDFLRQPGSAF
jgi:uncharacterized protein (DUF924 family)